MDQKAREKGKGEKEGEGGNGRPMSPFSPFAYFFCTPEEKIIRSKTLNDRKRTVSQQIMHTKWDMGGRRGRSADT